MKLSVQKLVDEKFPNKNQFAKALSINYPSVCKIYSGETTRISFDTLERICLVLECTPNDILTIDYDRYDFPFDHFSEKND